MKKIALVFFPILLFIACQKRHSIESSLDTGWSSSFYYQDNAKIDTLTHARLGYMTYPISRGDKIVFYCNVETGVKDNASDNEYGLSVTFQADANITNFTYKDEELAAHLSHYASGGAWSGTFPQLIYKGTISGRRLSDSSWRVYVDVQLAQRDDIIEITEVKQTGICKPVYW